LLILQARNNGFSSVNLTQLATSPWLKLRSLFLYEEDKYKADMKLAMGNWQLL